MSSDVPPSPKASASLAPASASAPVSAPSAPDVVLLGGPTADGGGIHVLRARNEQIETGELRALEHGKPITGEVVTLKPREGSPRICDVTDSFETKPAGLRALGAAPRTGHKGPAKVATDAYRQGWDEIFGSRPKPSGPAN
ncbi:MAG: hypothetical protein JWP97_5054 [Labilithrix sp.]|nr:hypothetical protein [Labilithrix sp.]